MSIRVGINGFGRIGRLVLRAAWGFDPIQPGSLIQPNGVWGKGAFEIVHINEIDGGIETAAHLLKFDSVHGTWPVDVAVDGREIHIGDRTVGFSEAATPGDVDWAAHGIDLVLECTGKFKSMDSLTPYFSRGVKKVVVSAPVKEPDVLNVV
ncbi:MAG: glyceraldehyde 3-phosphate dehydrogenase NAD-binding domain-containing protein, partial [Pseudomonadota bacterium]|nr:glyceraldehyde 3-phosphate dehydrogenase NAD-binding domain-containing protein [Pseudomonadota bacterium]